VIVTALHAFRSCLETPAPDGRVYEAPCGAPPTFRAVSSRAYRRVPEKTGIGQGRQDMRVAIAGTRRYVEVHRRKRLSRFGKASSGAHVGSIGKDFGCNFTSCSYRFSLLAVSNLCHIHPLIFSQKFTPESRDAIYEPSHLQRISRTGMSTS